jgi:putative membrane protein insertion efficiency factor
MNKLALKLIRLYQKTLSPDHGPVKGLYPYGFCRFYPSCSEYSYQAIGRFGLFIGCYLGFRRLLKCNPFSQPAHYPVPRKKS